ncbi:MAG TPA: arylsulfotransferase family protein, partial [Solirubrobacteraceae bacterium]|nr:arylsulfotransferase family protein [Solirubrobacteraceae bacterium]
MPGTPDASPSTQISFLGSGKTSVSKVQVRGSHSGTHSGALRAYSTGTGESFVPSHPFSAGERVTVTAQVDLEGASSTATTTFTVGHEAAVSQKQFALKAGDNKAVQHYSTAPSVTPSTVRVLTAAKPGASSGDFFLAPYQGKGAPGTMIVDGAGRTLWFRGLPPHDSATNFKLQQYEGKPALTWWQGRILGVGFGQGEYEIYNDAYEHLKTVRAGNGLRGDLHEFRLTPEGTAWIDMFDPVDQNLKSVHGVEHGVLTDSVIQEVDMKTGLVMWEWHALGHIPLNYSKVVAPGSNYPWDFVHLNSISPGQTGDVLLSSRNTWTLYDVD